MFGIEKDFQNLMEQVYGPLGKKEKEESDRMAKQLVDNAVKEVKEMTETHDLRNQWYDEPIQYETPMTEIEELKAQIKVLTKKLSLLEEIEKHKSPVEKAYRDAYGSYPVTDDMSGSDIDYVSWDAFKKGYTAAYAEKVSEEQIATQKGNIKTLVEESRKWCEENPDKDPLDCLKPQTPEQVADGLKEAFREAVKQGVVSSVDKPKDDFMDKMVAELKGQNLTDMIYDWWEDIFTVQSNDDMETSISDLVDRIEAWLPKEQSAAGSQNVYVECTVEGFNDCLNKIKRKLR